ncbi:MAG: GNAT family N-acetyltransferase [Calditrichaeota bacterium]|nr:GNAT family N-acetyltransferase [Calditrichota bacterium]
MIVRPAERTEYPEIYKLVDLAFKDSPLESRMIEITAFDDKNFQKGDVKVVEIDGKIVSVVMIIRRPIRIGRAIVNGAMIAPLATHPDYELKGCGSALMRDGVKYMKGKGIDIAHLWGHPGLYNRFGYTPAIMITEIVLNTQQPLPEITDSYECRPFKTEDLEQVTEIYHSNSATRTLAELRSAEMFDWKNCGDDIEFNVVVDKTDSVVGYYAIGQDWGRPCSQEIGVMTDSVSEFIFHRLLGRAKEKEIPQFYCLVNPEHPFARYAFRRYSPMVIKGGGGAGMVQVLNFVPLMTKLKEEFDRRIQHSEFVKTNFALNIICGEEQVSISVENGMISVSEDIIEAEFRLQIPLTGLNPLVTGYTGIHELLKNPVVKVKGGVKVIRLIDVLFPTGYPTGGNPPLVWE